MDFKTKKLSDVSVELSIKNTPAEVQEAFRSAYRKAQAKMKLPGFRAGKAPLEMVERQLGDSVAEEAARELIAGAFQQVFEKLDPAPISVPRFELESFDRQKGAAYRGAYDCMPKIKLGKYKKLKVVEDQAEAQDSDVAEELERLRQERGALVSFEGEARLEDFATISIDVSHGGKTLYQNKELHARLGGANTLPGVDEGILGMKAGEERQFEISIEEGFADERFAGRLLQVSVSLNALQQIELPELNDDLARDIGEFNDLSELRARLRESLTAEAREALKQRSMQAMLDQVVENTKFPLPPTLIEQELDHRLDQIRDRLGNKDLSSAEIARLAGQEESPFVEDLRKSAEKTVRERLALRELTREESIEVAQDDVDREIRDRYGAFLPEGQLPQLLQNEKLREEVQGRLLFWRAMNWLYDNGEVKKGASVSLSALREQGLLRARSQSSSR
ncbi:MAG: trigger factor [Leptospirales bacterium]|nr:trigger factor [Leptospirales bacterium]